MDLDGHVDGRGGTAVPRQFPLPVLVAVFLGGVAGGLARYASTVAEPAAPAAFPWATLAVNTAGAFCLPVLLTLLVGLRPADRFLRPLLGTGFLGAFTTFSSVATAADRFLSAGRIAVAAAYLAGSLVAAIVAVMLGLLLGRTVVRRRGAGAACS